MKNTMADVTNEVMKILSAYRLTIQEAHEALRLCDVAIDESYFVAKSPIHKNWRMGHSTLDDMVEFDKDA